MMTRYKIRVMTLEEIDKAFAILFAFGFVFKSIQRLNSLQQVKAEHCDDERIRWEWIIYGYDNECQMVFGVSNNRDSIVKTFTTVTLDDFLEIKCCCPLAWDEMKKTMDITTSLYDDAEEVELFKYSPWWC